jgi:hypothetical protein
MPRSICPFENCNGTYVYAYSVACTDFPAYGYIGSMYSKLLRWLYWSPDVVVVVLADNLALLLKVRINRQGNIAMQSLKEVNILNFPISIDLMSVS